MYLGCALVQNGFTIVERENRPSKKAGPDFCIIQKGTRVWIEAVTANIGTGDDSRAIAEEPPSDLFQQVPEDQIVLRFCSAIKDKYCNHLKHIQQGFVSADEPFLIAVNGGGIPVQFQDSLIAGEVPYAVRAVLPFGHYSVTFEVQTQRVLREGFEHQAYIPKLSGSRVDTTNFLDCTHGLASALLFSNVHPLDCSSVSLRDLSTLHNPTSLNKLQDGWLGSGTEWKLETTNEMYILHRHRVVPTA